MSIPTSQGAARCLHTMLPDPHRLAVFCLGLCGLCAAGLIGWGIADGIETRARARLAVLTDAAGFDWLDPDVNGTVVRLGGEAPDEASALAALNLMTQAGDWMRAIDAMTVAVNAAEGARGAAQQETLSLTVLRDRDSLALVGRAADTARDAMIDALQARQPGMRLTDLSDVQPGDMPPAWEAIAAAAAQIGAALQHGFVELGAGTVRVSGLPTGAFGPAQIRNAVVALRQAGVLVETSLVQAETTLDDPPVFTASIAEGTGRILLCDAPDAATGATIAATALALLDSTPAPCAIRPEMAAEGWMEATQAGLTALAAMKSGRFELYGGEARLIPNDDSLGAPFETASTLLAETIPAGFSLPVKPLLAAETPEIVATNAWIRARRSDGGATLTGTVPDDATRNAIATYAAAVLDLDSHAIRLEIEPGVAPDGWLQAALATLDGLGPLHRGEAVLRARRARVWGVAFDTATVARSQRAIDAIDGDTWETRTRITVDLPAVAAAQRLDPAACATALTDTKAREPVIFAPGEAGLDESSNELLDRLAETMRRCRPGIIEIGGHTDSQGSDSYNLRLSAARAAAVREALLTRDIGDVRLIAEGYGATQPIADNETDIGRARNRRIAFRHLVPLEPDDTAAPDTDGVPTGGETDTVETLDTAKVPATIKPVRRP